MKRIVVLAGAFCAALALANCSSAPGTLPPFDPSLPEDQTCTLRIDTRLLVKQFDGGNVRWSAGFWQGFEKGTTSIRIPAGPHSFLIDCEWNFSGTSKYHSRTGVEFSFDDFRAGRVYEMKPLVPDSYSAMMSDTIEFDGITVIETP